MVRSVKRESWIARTTPLSSPLISTIGAEAMATSVPVPMAIPTSDWASAGASFTPSPTMATRKPCPCNFFISAALSPGNTSARTVSTPTWRATASAVCRLSPVIMATFKPMECIALIAAIEPSFIVSATPISPANLPSTATSMTVLPSDCNRVISFRTDSVLTLRSVIMR